MKSQIKKAKKPGKLLEITISWENRKQNNDELSLVSITLAKSKNTRC